MTWQREGEGAELAHPGRLPALFVVLPLAAVLVVGVWMPPPLLRVLEAAAAVIQGHP
jgi:hypothetical protein